MIQLINFILHIDKYLNEIINNYGNWTYLILFLIIFFESILIVTTFLPGDTLIFMIGALGATGELDLRIVLILLIFASLGGNTLNYFIGKIVGNKILENSNIPIVHMIFKNEHIEKAHAFYEKYGGKAIIISRFLPLLRTFTPFAGGIAEMSFTKFTMYNAIAALTGGAVFMYGGYFFGNIPLVKENFTYVIFAIVVISFLPAFIAGFSAQKRRGNSKIVEEDLLNDIK
jgi:membrane-associated protein